MAERMLNTMLDEYVDEFDRRVAAGEPYELESYEGWIVERVQGELTSGA